LIPNPYTRWNQIDSELPNEPITLVIPASNHGTREVFQEKLVDVGCESFAYNLDKDDQKKHVHLSVKMVESLKLRVTTLKH
jgi:phosphate transport system substrate-binding protein